MESSSEKTRVFWKRILAYGLSGAIFLFVSLAVADFRGTSWASMALFVGAMACGALVLWKALRIFNSMEESDSIISALVKGSAILFILLLALYFMAPSLLKMLDGNLAKSCDYHCPTGPGQMCFLIANPCDQVQGIIVRFGMIVLLYTTYVFAAKILGKWSSGSLPFLP